MIDMIGVNPIFSSAVRMVIAQRLVRRLVDETKQEYEPDQATRDYVKRILTVYLTISIILILTASSYGNLLPVTTRHLATRVAW